MTTIHHGPYVMPFCSNTQKTTKSDCNKRVKISQATSNVNDVTCPVCRDSLANTAETCARMGLIKEVYEKQGGWLLDVYKAAMPK